MSSRARADIAEPPPDAGTTDSIRTGAVDALKDDLDGDVRVEVYDSRADAEAHGVSVEGP